jgi:uncharacterized protein (TIGR02246 family)
VNLWDRCETALVSHDFDGFAALFADDAVYIEPAGRHEGRANIRAWLDQWDEGVTDTRFETMLVVEDGDVIVAERAGTGVHTGALTTLEGSVVPPSGKTVVFSGDVVILRVKDGQIVEAHEYFDQLAILRQLGLLPGG